MSDDMIPAEFGAANAQDASPGDTDLTDLGFVLLDCMEGHKIPGDRRNKAFVLNQRDRNRVYGLKNAEHWSGSKHLIDFLDVLFAQDKTAALKMSRPVSFHPN